MNLSLDLKEIILFASTIVTIVASYFRGVSRTDQKLSNLKVEFAQRMADYKLEVIQTYVTRSDMGERFTELKHSIDSIDKKIATVLDKYDNRIRILEGRRASDRG